MQRKYVVALKKMQISRLKLLKYEISLGIAAKTKTQDITDICREAEDKMYKNKLSEGKSLRSSLIDSLRKLLKRDLGNRSPC